MTLAVTYQQVFPPAWEYPRYERVRWILAALDYSDREEDNIFTVMSALERGDAMGIDIVVDGQLKGFAVVEFMKRKRGEFLHVWTLGGGEMCVWLDGFLEYLEQGARVMGLEGVSFGGRPGWRKVLKKHGWDEQAVIMTKVIT